MARSVDAVMFESNVKAMQEKIIWDVDVVRDKTVVEFRNVMVGFDYGAPAPPLYNTPPNKDFDTHEVRDSTFFF